jgi:hypothetical protein
MGAEHSRPRRRTMPGFLKAATTVFTGGAIVGAGALMLLPSAPEGSPRVPSMFPSVRVSDLPPAACKQQLWLNTDRTCQSWTTPKPEVQRLLAAKVVQKVVSADNVTVVERTPIAVADAPMSVPKPVTASPSPAPRAAESDDPPRQIEIERTASVSAEPQSALPSGDKRLFASETVEEAQARAAQLKEGDRSNTARVARGADIRSTIPVTALSADGRRRVIVIRPTSYQDAMYYSARRELAAVNVGPQR